MLFAGIVAYLWPAPAAAERKPWRALADSSGTIARVVCVPHTASRLPLNPEFLQDFRRKLGPDKQLLLLDAPEDPVTLPEGAGADVRVIPLPAGSHVTIWPQDPFVVLRSKGGGLRLLLSQGFDRAGDAVAVRVLAQALGVEVQRSKLHFYGGNIVSDKRRVFVGADTVRDNMSRLAMTRQEVVAAFEEEFGRPVEVLGTWPQAVDHIDMVLTPIGRGRVVLGDAASGAAIAEAQLRAAPGDVRAFEESAIRTFGSGAYRLKVPESVLRTVQLPPVRGATGEAAAYSRRVAPWIEAASKQLEALGYQVFRVPLLMPPQGGNYEDPVRLGAWYPYLSYNNVLIERGRLASKVYLPKYGFRALDRAAAAAWGKVGFQVVPVEGLLGSAMYGGSLRCSAKVLERRPKGVDFVASGDY